MAATTEGIEVCNTLDVRGTTLVVNVNKRDKWSAYAPTVEIPLEHVLGAEADPEIEREMWRGWVFGRPGFWRSRILGEDGGHRAPDPPRGRPGRRGRPRARARGVEGLGLRAARLLEVAHLRRGRRAPRPGPGGQ